MLATLHIFRCDEWVDLVSRFSSIEAMLKSPSSMPSLEPRLQKCATLDLATLEKEVDRILQREDLAVILWGDDAYPALLKEISDPPLVIFVKGNERVLNDPQLKIGVVGSRKNTSYGAYTIKKIVSPLSKNNVTIVSGLAYGIDALAHKQAIEDHAQTVGVLGGGVDHIYPAAHKDLYRSVMEHGCILSEYLPDVKPLPRYFPQRNRIISGLSHGVLVVEATAKSGSLITARRALSQNREVFAVPGSIQSIYSEGTHHLIQNGAKLVTTHTDILDEFSWVQTSLDFGAASAQSTASETEQKVIEAIRDGHEHFDAILENTGMHASQLSEVLTMLTLNGTILHQESGYRLLRG